MSAAPALLPRERLPCGHLDIDENGKCVVCAAPKIESAEATGADVPGLVAALRAFVECWPDPEMIPHGVSDAADLLESYTRAIAEHNKRCERECAEDRGYIGRCRGGNLKMCATCPGRYMIEVPK